MHLQTRTDRNVGPGVRGAGRDWEVWWRLLRPHTLTASFVPVIIGTVLALPSGHFYSELFVAMLAASLLIQVSANMFNEYYDYRRGLDHEHSVGIGGAIVRDGVAPRTVMALALGVLAAALALGLYICLRTSWWLLPVGLVCAAVGYLYSGGPYPISATPFGELVAGMLMGLVIIAIAQFIQTGAVTAAAVLVSVPTSVLIGAILMANNIRDLEDDKKHGRKTLAILLTRNRAIFCLMGMFAFSYGWLVFLVVAEVVSPWALAALFSLPKALRASRLFRQNTAAPALMPAMAATAQTNTLFGALLAGGLLVHWF